MSSNQTRYFSFLLISAMCLCFSALFQPETQGEEKVYKPVIAPASSEGESAIGSFKVPAGHSLKLFAAEPMLANPVAFNIDYQGRVYVAESFRQEANNGIEDNRGHPDWLADDLKAQTVEERIKYVLKRYPEAAAQYTREQDRIRRLMDSNNDGVADSDTIFAGGFNRMEEGTGAGVLAVGQDVFYTCIPKLWKLTDTDNDGVAEKKVVLSDGYGVRYAFRGHDMHGLIRGPDGKIYFSIGDRGYHVSSKEGHLYHYPDRGAVFRCELDGSQLEIYANGLRNPQELAFDDDGNLFTWDNNSDGGDKARWTFVALDGDTGWRMNYQYLSDRGPWNRERIWMPVRNDPETRKYQPAYIVPPIANIGDGPSGICYDPGTGVLPEWKHRFFMADFRGGASNSGIRAIKLEPEGAGFKVADSQQFLWQILATDVDFGPDGKLYVLDWVHGWVGEGKGRIYTLENSLTSSPEVKSTRQLLQEIPKLKSAELFPLLGHQDRRVRNEATFRLTSLIAEDKTIVEMLGKIAGNAGGHVYARKHAIWCLAQGVNKNKVDEKLLYSFLQSPDLEIAKHTARILSEKAGHYAPVESLFVLLKNENSSVKYYAALALSKSYHLKETELAPVLEEILKNNNDDPWLRHALVMVLAKKGTVGYLSGLNKNDSVAVRLAAVVALRRQESPEVEKFLNDTNVAVANETARAIHDLTNSVMLSALPQLASLEIKFKHDAESDPLYRRVISANFRLGQKDNISRLIEYSRRTDLWNTLQHEVVEELLLLAKGTEFDRVTNFWLPVPPRPFDEVQSLIRPYCRQLLSERKLVSAPLIDLIREYKIGEVKDLLTGIMSDQQYSGAIRSATLKALVEMDAVDLKTEFDSLLKDKHNEVRVEALRLAVAEYPDLAISTIPAILENGQLKEKQNAILLLEKFASNPVAQEMVLLQMQKMLKGELPAGVHLELTEVACKSASPKVKEMYQQYLGSLPKDNPLAKFLICLEGGNVESGRQLFENNSTASCRRCHSVNNAGGGVGPELSEIGKLKNRIYLLESIVDPNKEIAKGFETVNLMLDSGKVVTGIVKEENEKQIKVILPLGEIQTIDKGTVVDRTKGLSGMPSDLIQKLSVYQIRDLVSYLETLKEKKQAGH